MLQFRPENHSVFRLYRFRNPAWEAEYQEKSREWRWYACMIHFYGRFVFSIPNMLSYQKWTALPPEFWLYVGIDALGLACALAGHFSAVGRRRVVELHFVVCLLVMAAYSHLCPQHAASMSQAVYTRWVPSPSHHLLVAGPDGSAVVDAPFLLFAQRIGAGQGVGMIVSEAVFPTLLHTCLTGLTSYTVPIIACTTLATLFSVSFTPAVDPGDLASNAVMLAAGAGFFFCVAAAVERCARSQFLAEVLLARELHASQSADSILNHTLKNVLCDVAATIELFLAGTVDRDTLEGAIHCLRRGMRACKERQVFLKLVAGEYTPALHAVDMQDFGQELVAGRKVQGTFVRLQVLLDTSLLNLVLDNAITNAFKHGHPDDPRVHFTIETAPLKDDPLSPGKEAVTFTVTNRANPQRPHLTPEYVAHLFAGKAEVPRNTVLPASSDRVGLTHCVLAAKAGIALDLFQVDSVVYFRATVDAEAVAHFVPSPSTIALSASHMCTAFPVGLRFAVLDDSLAARRLLHFHLTSWCSPSAVHCFGEREADIEAFVQTALHDADIVILDQNLDYSQPFLGTDVAQCLVQGGFGGFICMRSGGLGCLNQMWPSASCREASGASSACALPTTPPRTGHCTGKAAHTAALARTCWGGSWWQ
eukprot:EG_transcript_6145